MTNEDRRFRSPPVRPPVIDRLAPGYGPLFDRASDVFAADERVLGLWLSGSLARGTADEASDLDLLVAVDDSEHEPSTGASRDIGTGSSCGPRRCWINLPRKARAERLTGPSRAR